MSSKMIFTKKNIRFFNGNNKTSFSWRGRLDCQKSAENAQKLQTYFHVFIQSFLKLSLFSCGIVNFLSKLCCTILLGILCLQLFCTQLDLHFVVELSTSIGI